MEAEQLLKDIENTINSLNKEKNKCFKIDGNQYIGLRENQEDTIAYYQQYDEIFASLSDGIGGLEDGEVASALSCKVMLENCINADFINQDSLVHYFNQADQTVRKYVDDNQLMGSGCTLVSVFIKNNEMFFCSVGDSFLYLYRDGELKQLNRRHNYKLYLDELLSSCQINNDDYQANLDKKNVVISYIGKGNLNLLDFNQKEISLKKNDVIILLSDGVFNAINEDELIMIIKKNNNPATINTSIMNLIKMRKIQKQDNVSIISILNEKGE